MKSFWSILLLCLCVGLSTNAGDTAKSKMPMSSVFEKNKSFEFVPPRPGTYKLPIIKIAQSGAVVDHNNKSLELGEILDGKISILSFVYLSCSDIDGCPLILSNFFELYHQSALLPALKNKVQLITISFDPERDTVDAINSFQHPISADPDRSKKINWTVLTTENKKSLKLILDGYSQAITRNQDTELINHIIRIYLIDKTRKVRNIYGLGTLDPRLLITDVETLLLEENHNK